MVVSCVRRACGDVEPAGESDADPAGENSAGPAVVVLPQGVQRRLSIRPSHGRAGSVGRHRTPRRGSQGLMAADTTCAFGARAPAHQRW
jgi:hypothetical protein